MARLTLVYPYDDPAVQVLVGQAAVAAGAVPVLPWQHRELVLSMGRQYDQEHMAALISASPSLIYHISRPPPEGDVVTRLFRELNKPILAIDGDGNITRSAG